MTPHEAPDVARAGLARVPPAVAAALLLALYAALAASAAVGDSQIMDEQIHLAAGHEGWTRGEYRLNPEHPPLAKLWAAIPTALAGWTDFEYPAHRAEPWIAPRKALLSARCMVALLGVLLGLVVYLWARELWGARAALVPLFLYTLSPTMLAHGHLVTTDLAASLGFVLASWTAWRMTERPTWPRALAAGAGLGVALSMKFSTLMLIPILPGVAAALLLARKADRATWRRTGAAFLGAGLLAWILVWAGYGFKYAAGPLPWAQIPEGAKVVAWARPLRLLPESFLYGVAFVANYASRPAFLCGEIVQGGRWTYFPLAFLVKSTPAVLALAGWLLVEGLRRRRLGSAGLFLAVPAALYFAVAVLSPLQIGHRHLAPVYPALFLGAGWLASIAAERWRAWAIGGLLAAQALSGLAAHPRQLAYFNFAAGGSEGGSKLLADSNVDWGQDLFRLRKEMERRGISEVKLAYFGLATPSAHGIRARKVWTFFYDDGPAVVPRSGDVLAISVNVLHGMFGEFPKGRGYPDWKDWLAGIRKLTPIGRAGDSIVLYRVP